MTKKYLNEAHKKETETVMEGWMSQAGEDHRRLANKLEAIGLQTEDFAKSPKKHATQTRSSDGDWMRGLYSKLDDIAEGTFGPHNLPGAKDKDDDSDADDAEDDSDKDDKEEVDEGKECSDCECTPCECK